jgi:hypothetical protein
MVSKEDELNGKAIPDYLEKHFKEKAAMKKKT